MDFDPLQKAIRWSERRRLRSKRDPESGFQSLWYLISNCFFSVQYVKDQLVQDFIDQLPTLNYMHLWCRLHRFNFKANFPLVCWGFFVPPLDPTRWLQCNYLVIHPWKQSSHRPFRCLIWLVLTLLMFDLIGSHCWCLILFFLIISERLMQQTILSEPHSPHWWWQPQSINQAIYKNIKT